MNLQQLEYIIALDKFKSFSKAADSCFITQATLSTMVKRLETELQLTIFDRKISPILTTECGFEVIEAAKIAVSHINRMKQMSAELVGKVEGELKLGVIPTVASNLLHRLVPFVLRKYPNLKFSIKEITTQNIVEQLKTGQLDAGIVSTPLRMDGLEEDLLYYEKLKVYGKINQVKIRYLKPDDIARENVWLMEEGNCISDQIVNVCSLKNKRIHPNLNFQPNSFDSLINMVDCLNGITLVPELYIADLAIDKKMKVTDFISPFPVREISLIYTRPYAKHRLIEALKSEIILLIRPLLETAGLQNDDMIIAEM